MLKQFIAIILLSVIVILTMSHVQHVLQWIVSGHEWVSQILLEVFSGGATGSLIRNLISILVIPLFVASIPVVIYWLAKRSWFPYFMEFAWVTWIVQTAALVMQYKVI